MTSHQSTVFGTAGGTFLSIIPNIRSEDFIRTIILAAVGAVISFLITLLLKFLTKLKQKK
jgi:hypothetical protein